MALGSIPDKPNTVCRVARAVGAVPTMLLSALPVADLCDRARSTPYPLTSTRSRRIPAATRLSRHDTCRLLIAIKQTSKRSSLPSETNMQQSKGKGKTNKRSSLPPRPCPRSARRFNGTDRLETLAQKQRARRRQTKGDYTYSRRRRWSHHWRRCLAAWVPVRASTARSSDRPHCLVVNFTGGAEIHDEK